MSQSGGLAALDDAALFPRWRTQCLIVAAFAILPFLSALGNGFLSWDDNIIILGQPFLRELSLENLWTILSPVPAREEWLPLRDLTLLVSFALFGESPLAFLAGNVALHAGASIAVLHLLRRLVSSRLAALLGALVFACHAAHVESVTWLSGRKDPLSALFLVLALLAHVRWREGRGRYATVLPLLACALLSKASAFVFPLWAAAYDLFYLRGLGWRDRARPLVPYACLAFAGIATFLSLIRTDGVIEEYPGGGLTAVLLTNAISFRDYALHVLLPLRHQAIYEIRFAQSPLDPAFLSAAAFLAVLMAIAWCHRGRPWVPFSILFFFVNFIPYLNIVPHGIYYAERYLYLPSIAFALAVGQLGAWLLGSIAVSRPARLATAGALCLFLAAHVVVTSSRNHAWADSETFWQYQASVLPGNPAPLMNLGETREIAGDDVSAAKTYGKVLDRFGEVPEAVYRLGRIARRQGDLETATRIYERQSRLCPDDPRSLNNLAELRLERRDLDGAIEIYRRVTREHPRYLLARANLARTLEAAGRPAEAIEHWRFIAEHAELLPQELLVREAQARLTVLQ